MTRPALTRKVSFTRELRDPRGRPFRRVTVDGRFVGTVTRGFERGDSWQFWPNDSGKRACMSQTDFRTLDEFRRALQPGSVTNGAKALFRTGRFSEGRG